MKEKESKFPQKEYCRTTINWLSIKNSYQFSTVIFLTQKKIEHLN